MRRHILEVYKAVEMGSVAEDESDSRSDQPSQPGSRRMLINHAHAVVYFAYILAGQGRSRIQAFDRLTQ